MCYLSPSEPPTASLGMTDSKHWLRRSVCSCSCESATPCMTTMQKPNSRKDTSSTSTASRSSRSSARSASVAPPPPPPPPPPPAVNGFEAEAAELASELSRIAGDISGGGAAAANGKVKLPALSSMKKAQLVAECEERGVESDGTVAELRAMLRVERKRDAKIAELEERGWADKQARAALAKCEWDVDLAISQLLKK